MAKQYSEVVWGFFSEVLPQPPQLSGEDHYNSPLLLLIDNKNLTASSAIQSDLVTANVIDLLNYSEKKTSTELKPSLHDGSMYFLYESNDDKNLYLQ